jgi:hypothetical protein
MAVRFPSLDFWQTLERLEQSKPISLVGQAGGDALVGIGVDDHAFMPEFEDGMCFAAALGGNPNDMDYTLSGPESAWRELFARIASGAPVATCLEQAIGPDASIRVESLQDEGLERWREQLPILESFFGLATDVELA